MTRREPGVLEGPIGQSFGNYRLAGILAKNMFFLARLPRASVKAIEISRVVIDELDRIGKPQFLAITNQ